MKETAMRRIVFVFLLGGTAIPGCILTGTVYRVVEPLEEEFVDVRNVDGTTLMLADGRRGKLAGIRAETSRDLENSLRHQLVGQDRILLFEEGDGFRAEVSMLGLPSGCGNPIAIVLFPTVQTLPAYRLDIGLELVACGWAKAAPEEIMDEVRRKAYVDAEEKARLHRSGLWGSGENGSGDAKSTK